MKIRKNVTGAIAAMCAAVLCASVMAGCSENPERDSSAAETQPAETSSAAEEAVESEEEPEESAAEEESSEEEAPAESEAEKTEEPEETSSITPAMWKITGDNGVTITLMGSMHALAEEDYPLPAQITDALESSDVLAVECDTSTTDNITFQAALLKAMYCDEGKSFSDYVSGEAYDAVAEYLKSYSLDISAFELYKPWAVSNTLDSLPLLYSGLSADKGIDGYLIAQAKEQGKEIHEVESVDFQMDMIMNFSDEIYDLMFRSLKDQTQETMVESLLDLHEAWAAGDVDRIIELNEEEEEEMSEEDSALADEYYKAMIYDRNIGMEEDIKELLKGDKDVFFVVGALHFVDEGGILDLLEKDGISCERIEY